MTFEAKRASKQQPPASTTTEASTPVPWRLWVSQTQALHLLRAEEDVQIAL